MIITLNDTDTAHIGAKLIELRAEGGVVALGRVLTLVIVASGDNVADAIESANDASREHPCRVIVIVDRSDPDAVGLDAEIRIGADAGASEVIVLHTSADEHRSPDTLVTPLLLPDAPIVAWWPHHAPSDMAKNLLGSISQRRISDVLWCDDPIARLGDLATHYAPGDTDLSWARTTLWRGLAAAALDNPPFDTVEAARVVGNPDHPATRLFAAWFAYALDIPVTVARDEAATAITAFELERASGTIAMRRPEGRAVLTITVPDQPQQQISLPLRDTSDCLVEDLRRLDPDDTYGATLINGLPRIEVTA